MSSLWSKLRCHNVRSETRNNKMKRVVRKDQSTPDMNLSSYRERKCFACVCDYVCVSVYMFVGMCTYVCVCECVIVCVCVKEIVSMF
jgi:hypothetical protein